ncbi:MAG: hypothetical protein PF489_14325 [Salinivirgaceae bacterium]|jgi:hypothetical protein|nr:hypothetical protein [Salinivirgaceae bacterium]
MIKIITTRFFILVLFTIICGKTAFSQKQEMLTFPFSQYVVRNDWAAPMV